ncbi:MAG TPA: hypothetical protein DDW81_08800, partial [Cryomorphaceae bacterium]|nr:hypothetical protein [Cryomorphaceae bacterium]
QLLSLGYGGCASNRQEIVSFSYICAMRWFSAILSIYFLGLSLLPCADFDQVTGEYGQQVFVDHDHSGHTHDIPADDQCSPFCMCHCCHTHVVESATIAIALLPPEGGIGVTNYSGRLLTADEQVPPQPPQA